MIVQVSWETFQTKYLSDHRAFVKEYDDRWCIVCDDGLFHVKCDKMKSENTEENISFVDRYLSDKKNVIKVLDIEGYEEEEEVIGDDDDEEYEVMIEEKASGHKYIKRVGSSGNYRYTYIEPSESQGGGEKIDKKIQEAFLKEYPTYSDVEKKLFSTGNYWDMSNLNIPLDGLKKGSMSQGLKERRIVTQLIFEKYKNFIASDIKDMKKSYTHNDYDGLARGQKIATNIYNLGKGGYESSYSEEQKHKNYRENIIELLRTGLNNDTKEINKALKYMNWKERAVKGGLKQSASSLSRDDIEKRIRPGTFKGISYKVSPTFVSNTKGMDTDGFKTVLKNSIEALPEKAKELINEGKTSVHFVTRQDAKKLDRVGAINARTMGYYNPRTKQVFIFPPKGGSTGSKLSPEKMKADGYDQKIIDRLANGQKTDTEKLTATIVHELSHAAALNTKDLQDKYDAFLDKNELHKRGWMSSEDMKKEEGYVSRYAMSNTKEDFAETFSFYAMYRGFIKGAIRKKDSWVDVKLKMRFEFMEELWK